MFELEVLGRYSRLHCCLFFKAKNNHLHEGPHHGFSRQGIQEGEAPEVVEMHLLEVQNDGAEIAAEDLGRRVVLLVLEALSGVEPVAFTGPGSPGATGSLLGRRLADRCDEEGVHLESRTEDVDFRIAYKSSAFYSLFRDIFLPAKGIAGVSHQLRKWLFC